jgi:hypothetical protein
MGSKCVVYEVIEIVILESSQVTTPHKVRRTVTLQPVYDETDHLKFRMGSLTGRYTGNSFQITLIDPELFDKFVIGQKFDLLKGLL